MTMRDPSLELELVGLLNGRVVSKSLEVQFVQLCVSDWDGFSNDGR